MSRSQEVVIIIYKMLRLRTALLILLFVALADGATKSDVSAYNPKLILVAAALASWYISGTSINDLADEEIDQINLQGNSGRPLANKETDRRFIWLVSLGAGIVALLASLALGWQALVITLGALVLNYIYSMPPIKLSYRGILAPLSLPIGYVLYPCLLTFIANDADVTAQTWWLVTGLYISFIARIILKDFRDVKGDKKFGKRTFIVRHGAKATCLVSTVAWLVGTSVLMVRFASWPLFEVALVPYIFAILYALRWLSHEKRVVHQVQLVGLIGRLANGAALLMLTALYYEVEPAKTALYTFLLIGVALFGLSAAYTLYESLLKGNLSGTSKAA